MTVVEYSGGDVKAVKVNDQALILICINVLQVE